MRRSKLPITVGALLAWIAGLTTPALALEPPVAPEATVPSAPPEPSRFEAGFERGFFIRSAGAREELRIRARLQLRYTWLNAATPTGRKPESAFAVQRGRLQLLGYLLADRLRYLLHIGFDRGDVALRDMYVDGIADRRWLHVRFGQMKLPWSRQRLASSAAQQFVDRAITDRAFGAGRDIGVLLHNGLAPAVPLEWAFGVFNGTGDTSNLTGTVTVDPATGEGAISGGGFSNVPKRMKPLIAARLGYNRAGADAYTEPDLRGGPVRGAAAISAILEPAASGAPPRVRAEVDGILKWNHLSVSAALYLSAEGDRDALASVETKQLGFHAQAGQVLGRRKRGELAARYARVNVLEGGWQDESSLAGTLFISGHTLQCTTDLSLLRKRSAAGEQTQDPRVRVQLQMDF
ncbi:MAG: porin [Myxococcota bacterium]